MKIFKNVILPNLFLILAFFVLVLKIGSPFHRYIAAALFIASIIRVALTVKRHRVYSEYKPKLKDKLRPYRYHILAFIVILIVMYVCNVLIPVQDSFLTEMTPEQLSEEYAADYNTLVTLQGQCDDFFDNLQTGNWAAINRALRPDEVTDIRDQRRVFGDMFLEYSFFKEKYKGYYLIDYLSKPALHSDAFFLVFWAYAGQYEASLKVVRMVGGNEVVAAVLNEGDEAAGFPKDGYFYIKQRLTNPDVLLRLNAGKAYLKLVKKNISFPAAAVAELEQRLARISDLLGRDMDIFIKNPIDMLEKKTFENWLPAQKNIAIMMGRVHPSSRPYYITGDIIKNYADRFEPGDVIITRRKWHLSNVGIPGFWTHSVIYAGTRQQINEFFATETDELPPFEQIKQLNPDIAIKSVDDHGSQLCCIEAIEQGVLQHSLEDACHADYIAVLRPKTTPEKKFMAVKRAFSFLGRPYDYNFDFATESSLVCSEVVYKAYNFLEFPIEPQKQNGRFLLSPNEIARKYDLLADDEDFPVEFVLFLDIKDGQVIEADVQAFRDSYKRPKWDIMLE
ncbi:MAG: YiiX/YebB-like N1pC/P60 family cysteine hydrolase [Sedimentisphaeraceae bacterium JB056]